MNGIRKSNWIRLCNFEWWIWAKNWLKSVWLGNNGTVQKPRIAFALSELTGGEWWIARNKFKLDDECFANVISKTGVSGHPAAAANPFGSQSCFINEPQIVQEHRLKAFQQTASFIWQTRHSQCANEGRGDGASNRKHSNFKINYSGLVRKTSKPQAPISLNKWRIFHSFHNLITLRFDLSASFSITRLRMGVMMVFHMNVSFKSNKWLPFGVSLFAAND